MKLVVAGQLVDRLALLSSSIVASAAADDSGGSGGGMSADTIAIVLSVLVGAAGYLMQCDDLYSTQSRRDGQQKTLLCIFSYITCIYDNILKI